MYGNDSDGVTDFEVCGFTKTQKSKYLQNETALSAIIYLKWLSGGGNL